MNVEHRRLIAENAALVAENRRLRDRLNSVLEAALSREAIDAIAKRFWPKVDRSDPDGCWPWTGAKNSDGYGSLSVGKSTDGTKRSVRAHRLSHLINFGPVPPGMHVLHRCDNPPCVKPGHLFLGTHQENVSDREAKGRGKPRLLSAAAEAKVIEVYVTGKFTQPQLCEFFGVGITAIGKIIKRAGIRGPNTGKTRRCTPEEFAKARAALARWSPAGKEGEKAS